MKNEQAIAELVAIAKLRSLLCEMPEDDRKRAMQVLLVGFCRDCMRYLMGDEACHCENDE